MMSINQKLELSREIRQWIGTALSIGSIAAMAFAYFNKDKIFK